MYSHPLYYKWQRRRRILNVLQFWTPILCIVFLVVYAFYFAVQVAA